MSVIMNMSNYEIEREALAQSDEGLKHRGWNPPLHLATLDHMSSLIKQHTEIPVSLVTADAETFLQSMYAYQG
ncbi:MAG: hypothetical protein WCI39_00605 [Gallionellaceae bacterium]